MEDVIKCIISKLKERGISKITYELTDEGWAVNIKTNIGSFDELPEDLRDLLDVLENAIERFKPSREDDARGIWEWRIDGVEIVKQILL